MRATLILFLAILSSGIVMAQTDDNITTRWSQLAFASSQADMHTLATPSTTASNLLHGIHHLFLNVDADAFFYDVENSMPFAKGYTITGFRLTPTLNYGINQRSRLRVGMDVSLFAGMDSLYYAKPVFSLIYMPTQWLIITAGTINGGLHHDLGLPAYDPARWITNPVENGLQIETDTRHWNSDTWLDWEHYLKPWTPDQERFTMGSRHVVNFFKYTRSTGHPHPPCCAIPMAVHDTMNRDTIVSFVGDCFTPEQQSFNIDIPFHFLASHRGGEVKTIDTNTVTTFNERIGLRLRYLKSNLLKGRTHRVQADFPLYFYHLEDSQLDHGGKGFYPTLRYEFINANINEQRGWCFHSTAGYWHGDHYFSNFGSPQFFSANSYSLLHLHASPSLSEDIRDMITADIAFEHEFRDLKLGIQVNAFYDLTLQKTDFIFAFYMRFGGDFVIF